MACASAAAAGTAGGTIRSEDPTDTTAHKHDRSEQGPGVDRGHRRGASGRATKVQAGKPRREARDASPTVRE